MSLRISNIERLANENYDVLIIGGGINGAVSAAALSGRGVKVALIDREDFASGTSSESSNLAWGGIKYLESYDFLLVNSLCKSRNTLMKNYPSTVKEIRFMTTIAKGFRYPVFVIYLGAWLYWVFGRFVTKAPSYHSIGSLRQYEPIINTRNAQGGLEYSDCYLHDNDARFVFNFVRTAMNYDCIAANYVESLGAKREKGLWLTTAKNTLTGEVFEIRSRVLINACGPWVDRHNRLTGQQTEHRHLFSRGVHLIVDKITDNKRVLAFFASDGRLFFIIPMGPKTCIGTTDDQVDQPETEVTDKDREFILDNVNALLDLPEPLTKSSIIAERCGVRPLAYKGGGGIADWVKLSRKHAIDVNREEMHMSIFGGKLTDSLNVGNEVADMVEQLGIHLPYPTKRWYGEADESVHEEFLHQARLMELDNMTNPAASEPLTSRLWRRYGANALEILEGIREHPERSQLLIEKAEYLRGEIELAARREMITKLEDFLRRRSKISQVVRHEDLIGAPGLKKACEIFFGDEAEQKLAEYFREHGSPART